MLHSLVILFLNDATCAVAGKLNRGMSVVDTVEILKGSSLTETEYTKAAILGWCIELVRLYFNYS